MNKLERLVNNYVSHYNHKKYWEMKEKLCNPKTSKLLKCFYLYRLKRSDAFNSASLGHRINGGSKWGSAPILPHGIKGIFVTDKAHIGKNVKIYQQVTIGINREDEGGPTIGDNCLIGVGAKVIGNITIGNNVKIGANAVVFEDVPDYATVVLNKPRTIIKK